MLKEEEEEKEEKVQKKKHKRKNLSEMSKKDKWIEEEEQEEQKEEEQGEEEQGEEEEEGKGEDKKVRVKNKNTWVEIKKRNYKANKLGNRNIQWQEIRENWRERIWREKNTPSHTLHP